MNGLGKSHIDRGIALISLCAMVLVGHSPAVAIDTTQLSLPADSPIWWTISDDITSVQLRAILRDPKAHVERYRIAMKKGYAAPVSEHALEKLVWYQNGALWPEFISFYDAFDALATNMYMGDKELRWRREGVEKELVAAGMSADEAKIVLDTVPKVAAKEKSLSRQYNADQMQFVRLLEKVIQRTGEDLSKYAQTDPASVVKIARITAVPESRVRALRELYLRDPIAGAVLPAMQRLRQELSEPGWRGLRTFLRTRVAPQISSVDFAARKEDVKIIYSRYKQ